MKHVNMKTSSLHLSPTEKVTVWNRARGMWKNRKPDPLKELEKRRAEW